MFSNYFCNCVLILKALSLTVPEDKGTTSILLRGNNFEPRIIHPAMLAFIHEGYWKTFSDTKRLRKYIHQEPFPKILLNDLLQPTKTI